MTKACPALAPVALLTARGLLSLVLGASAFPQNVPPTDTINPSLFQLQHTSWIERDGAPPTINGIAQAPDGSLWLGSGEGLYRFDGFTFEHVRAIDGDSPAPTEVNALLAASNGDLWIGTSFNGTILLRNGVAKRFPKFEGIPLNTTVWRLAEDLDGTIWAATASGLQRFDGSEWRSAGKAWGLPEMVYFPALQLDGDGTLWTEATEHGLFRLKRGLHHFERLADLPREFLSFDHSPSGEYWANTNSGICPLAEVLSGTPPSHCAVHDKSGAPPAPMYRGLIFDRRGNLWMKSRGGGMDRLDAGAFRDAFRPHHPEWKVESFTKRDGLTSDAARFFYQDRRDGSIWVGTDHGLDHFRESSFLPALPKPGVSDFGIQVRKDGRVWIGSQGGGGLWIASPAGKTERVVLPGIGIESLYETSRGTLWFGTYSPSAGAIVASIPDGFNGGKATSLPLTPDRHSQVGVQSIVEDGGGALWVSFIPYGLVKWEGGHWIKNGGLTGLPEAWVVILNTGPDGRVWAGYLNGEAAVIDGTSVRTFSAKNGLNIGPVAAILSGPSDCWLAGVNGLARFDGQRFHLLSEADNRQFSGITGIAKARNGDLWLNSWEGVRRVPAAELREAEKNPAYTVHSDRYDLTDGLPSVPQRIRPFPTAVSAPNGRIWFGLRSGVVSVDPENPSLSFPAPPVSVVRAIADGKTFNDVTNIKLAARTRNLEIDYTAVSLNRASRVRFRYKLENADAAWRDAGSRRQAFYNDLRPGKYRFMVSASNGDNLWNEGGAALDIDVPPAFIQTIWFKTLMVLAGIGLIGLLYRIRLQQITARADLRYAERLEERTRIARELHDTMLQSFQGSLAQMQAGRNLLSRQSDRALQAIDDAITMAAGAIAEGRDAVSDLRSSTAFRNNLAEELKAAADELAEGGGATFRLVVEGPPRELHPVIQDEICRIGGEALRNAFRHARAHHIEADVRYSDQLLRLQIRDDGVGITPEILEGGRSNHYGLCGMRERAEKLGAKLEIWSATGTGTEIDLSIPAARVYRSSAPRARRRLFTREWK
jgi:signal transduction histidine kinase/ligand-binding sensor domain-containing protein